MVAINILSLQYTEITYFVRVFAICLMGVFSQIALAEPVQPDELIMTGTVKLLHVVERKKKGEASGDKSALALIEEAFGPIFDFTNMTKIALGKNWPSASPNQQESLVNVFSALLVRTYYNAISNTFDYRFEFKPIKLSPSDDYVNVKTDASKSNIPPIRIEYAMENKSGKWLIVDVTVDGVGLASVYRRNINSEVKKGGIEGLLASLSRLVTK